jgi:hypothetical protein
MGLAARRARHFDQYNAGKLVAHVGAVLRWLPPLLHENVGGYTSPSARQDRHADEVVTPASVCAARGSSSGARPIIAVRLTSSTRSVRRISPSPEGTTSLEAAADAAEHRPHPLLVGGWLVAGQLVPVADGGGLGARWWTICGRYPRGWIG